jgi:hypothetical protein
MRRNLVEHRITAEQADRIEQAMRQAFEEAEVDPHETERLEPAMTNAPRIDTCWPPRSPPTRNGS